jgi:hypothetical protein
MGTAMARHDELVRSAVEARSGYVFSTGGDGFAVAFARAGDAVVAALDTQSVLAGQSWPTGVVIRVRMGLHTGEAEERDGDYFGSAVNRAARLMGLAHGGQVVASSGTADVAIDSLPQDVKLVDLGEHLLRDLFRVVSPPTVTARLRPWLVSDVHSGERRMNVIVREAAVNSPDRDAIEFDVPQGRANEVVAPLRAVDIVFVGRVWTWWCPLPGEAARRSGNPERRSSTVSVMRPCLLTH